MCFSCKGQGLELAFKSMKKNMIGFASLELGSNKSLFVHIIPVEFLICSDGTTIWHLVVVVSLFI